MLPVKKSVHPRSWIAAEVRVPDDGTWCAALAREVSDSRVVLAMFRGLPVGTRVIVALSLPDGVADVDGVVSSVHEVAGVTVTLDPVSNELLARLSPAPQSAVA